MKKAGIVFLILMGSLQFIFGENSLYKINDKDVDALFANAKEISTSDVAAMSTFYGIDASKIQANSPNPVVATILAMPWLGVGVFGVHRLYLGTETGTFLAYLFTLGGCGVISLVDFIVLVVGLIEEDISQYVDNPKFIMWAN